MKFVCRLLWNNICSFSEAPQHSISYLPALCGCGSYHLAHAEKPIKSTAAFCPQDRKSYRQDRTWKAKYDAYRYSIRFPMRPTQENAEHSDSYQAVLPYPLAQHWKYALQYRAARSEFRRASRLEADFSQIHSFRSHRKYIPSYTRPAWIYRLNSRAYTS